MSDSLMPAALARLRQQRTAPVILELDLSEGISESRPADPVSALMARNRTVLADLLDALRRARDDHRVVALVAKLGGRNIGLAAVQEIRRAVRDFAGTGKATVAWADSYGEFSAGNVQYYLATAFDTVWLQPSGDLGLTGIAVERVFLRGVLDKVGAEFEVAKRYEYKSAAEQLTERGFSEPAREATERLTASVTEQLTQAIAERRKLPVDTVSSLINAGPFLASQAQANGLVDHLGYRDEVYASVRKQAGPDAILQYVGRYHRGKLLAERARKLATNPAGQRHEPVVALIHATGPIRRGRGGRGPMAGPSMGSDSIAGAIRAAAKDQNARAILLRVNSPGGSYVASDTIWREVVRARADGTPVIVSMGDVAASGGYFISMAADVIVAQPGTVTGSIGVITAKPVLGEALGRAGVSSDLVSQGDHAAMFSQQRPFSEDEWTLVNDWLDHIYDDFTGKVAEGRGLTREQVHELARGRVWSGADAHARGLVDELGGLDRAAAIARRRAGLPPSAELRVYPRVRAVERLIPAGSSEGRGSAGAPLAGSVLADMWGPVWQLAARAGLHPRGPLMLPGSWTFE
jgi:protease IV